MAMGICRMAPTIRCIYKMSNRSMLMHHRWLPLMILMVALSHPSSVFALFGSSDLPVPEGTTLSGADQVIAEGRPITIHCYVTQRTPQEAVRSYQEQLVRGHWKLVQELP